MRLPDRDRDVVRHIPEQPNGNGRPGVSDNGQSSVDTAIEEGLARGRRQEMRDVARLWISVAAALLVATGLVLLVLAAEEVVRIAQAFERRW